MTQNQEKPWLNMAVFICTKCHNSFPPEKLNAPGNTGENLKNYLKENLKHKNLNKKCRVMTSSCLGVCPNEGQAVLIEGLEGNHLGPILVINPEEEKEMLLNILIKANE